MKIVKKVQCLKCQAVIEGENAKCTCGSVSINENTIVGVDYKDLTPKLLTE